MTSWALFEDFLLQKDNTSRILLISCNTSSIHNHINDSSFPLLPSDNLFRSPLNLCSLSILGLLCLGTCFVISLLRGESGGQGRNNSKKIVSKTRSRQFKDFDGALPVSAEDFINYMSQATEFLVDYHENIGEHPVTTDKLPGFLTNTLSSEGPMNPESFSNIMEDVKTKILPGLTHWQHKRFHAYFPHGCSFPDVIAESIVAGLGAVAFTYDACPAIAEMERAMVNWLGRALGLSEKFLFQELESTGGGGSIQPSASDSVYMAVMASRFKKIKEVAGITGDEPKDFILEKQAEVLQKLVAYSSPEAHSSFEKTCNMAMVRLHVVKSDENFSLRGAALEKQIEKDIKKGLIPFHVQCTLGTTTLCAFDNLEEVGEVAQKYGLWFHVDGAYAGSALICPEFRHLAKGLDSATSFNVNPHKMLLQSCRQAVFWTQDQAAIFDTFQVSASYYVNAHANARDPRDWGVPLGRPFNGLRLWFLFRMYGISNLQAYIRRLVNHAATFENLIQEDDRLEIVGKRELGLVCFKLKDYPNKATQDLVDFINRSHRILVTHSMVHGIDFCRVCVNHERATDSDILESWEILQDLITQFLAQRFS